jgi:hypothetical protein
LAGVDRLGAEGDGLVAMVGGQVVVVVVERARRQAEPRREGVEFRVARVAHQVSEAASAPLPDRGVDEHGHGVRPRRAGSHLPPGLHRSGAR